MVKILSLLVLSLLLFAGGLAGALYMRPATDPAEAEGNGEVTPTSANAGGGAAGAGNPGGANAGGIELPTAVVGRPMSSDDVFRITASLRARERDLKRREDSLEQREGRLKMIEEDLRGQRREVDGLMQELQDTLERTTDTLQKVKTERQELQQEQAKAATDLKKAQQLQEAQNANQLQNIKKVSEWIEKVPEDVGAMYLKELVDAGNMDMAVKVLANIEQRNAAKFLAAMEKPLMREITTAFLDYQRPTKK
ncbi:MAG: hypothetical protein KDB14_02475 [Planctomycetales bacterium]|nr:hypothetical protein [Planctomycetales bacterium]